METDCSLMKRNWISLVLALFLLLPASWVGAQEEQVEGPVYIVQPGDSLWKIAQVFDVALDDLIALNQIQDPGQLPVGTRLLIPGLEGVNAVLEIHPAPFGENFWSLSRRYQLPFEDFARLNRITSPAEVYAGMTLILPQADQADQVPQGGRATLERGQSLLELAISQNVSPWELVYANGLPGTWAVAPGETLHIPSSEGSGPGALPEKVESIEVSPLPVVQGQVVVIRLKARDLSAVRGQLADWPLHFFPVEDGFVALQGVHAMQEPGLYPLRLNFTLPDGTPVSFVQQIVLRDGNYPFDPPLVVNSETVDSENTQPEDLEWFSIVEPVTPVKMWDGVFRAPMPDTLKDCYPSRFGNRRSYNGSAYRFFHTGLDFCGQSGVEIYAPAPGVVVFTGSLTVRGNATVIDHGWGVYTAYAHQSEIFVQVGERVETGQVIGLVGSTGRVTGPHLHWEVIVGGVQVDPLPWLSQGYP